MYGVEEWVGVFGGDSVLCVCVVGGALCTYMVEHMCFT